MKKLHYTLAALFVSSIAMAQGPTTTENYIYNTTYQVKTLDGTTNAVTQQPLTEDDKIESITYFDGLGRPKQQISRQAGGNKQDILVPIVYDAFGRQVQQYLPYANPLQDGSSTSLGFVNPTNLLSDLNAYYIAKYPVDINGSVPNPFSETHYESSPLNRVLEQGAPGIDWKIDKQSDTDHTIKFEYKTNSTNEVAYYKVIFPTGNTEQPQLFYSGLYQANQLYKTITKDENWKPSDLKNHTTEEFKDKQGRVILKRTYTNQVPHDTYYVYDDFGNLTYVLSPKGSDLVLSTNGYKNYDETFSCDYLVPLDKGGEKTITDCSGQLNITIDDVNLDLTVEMSASFNTPINLRNGPIVQLDTTIPNMIVGTITTGGVNYIVSIQDGFLHISGSGVLSSISETLIVSLPTYSVQTNIVNDLCYQYHYDYRNRLVEKKIPQKGWEYIVYDKLDRPVLTQDEYQRLNDPTKKGWLFTKYDAFGRVAFTGQHISNLTRIDIQAFVNSSTVLSETSSSTPTNINGVSLYYTNNVYPQNTLTVYTINYYDTYNPELSAAFSNPNVVLGTPVSSNTKTLPTGSKVRVLGTNDWTTTVSYYDEKGQPIYIGSKNTYLNTTDIIKTQLDFVGKVLKTESSHTKDSNSPIIVTDNFTYDHTGRLLTQNQQIGTGNIETIVNNTYDELGQLVNKGVGGIEASPLQVVDYKYNIRGWLKSINDKSNLGTDLFAFGINYNTTELGQTNTPLYNGNISETTWKTANDVSTNTTRGYAYSYDALNRLTTANMSINTGSGFSVADGYHENGFNYDKNGNILSLQRVGAVDIFDNLTYFYNGNQLTKVNDAITNQQTEGFIDGNTTGDDYSYDTNGNMIEDKNKNITSITYNHLNLPTQIQIANQGNIVYTYDATGTKLSKTVNPLFGTYQSTFYAGNYIYETLAGNPILKFFNHAEGYVEPDGQGGYNYVYQYKDHLGNIRLSYSDLEGNYQQILDSDFENDFNGWQENGSVNYLLDNGRVKANVDSPWEGIRYDLTGVVTVTGETLKVKVDFDKGNTQSDVRLYLPEFDSNDNLVRYNVLNWNLQSGHSEYTLTMLDSGNTIKSFHIDKDDTNTSTTTYFYVGHVTLERGEIEIVEENNYYPFGLKHKGYNNVVSPSTNSVATKFEFQGVEFEKALGLNLHEMDFRNYDPALGRFTGIDPVTHHSMSPYVAFDNNPIFWVDPSGADARDPIKETNTIISSRVDKNNVTYITQTTTTSTTTTNEDGSVSVTYSSGSITNTVDANGNVTNGTTVTTTSGTITKDVNGKISASDPTTATRGANSNDGSSALREWTGVVSDYNKNNEGIYNKDKINELSDKTTKATKAGVAVISLFGGVDKFISSTLDSKTKKIIGLVGGVTSFDTVVGKAGDMLKNEIGQNNGHMMIYGVEQVINGATIKQMKTPSNPDGNRKRVGPTSFQDLFKGSKWLEWWNGGKN
ncbi:DUF6443 domain-containing protein [Aquaticitalea lipolytica]|nr:DUF6443 domain-containing protein [Aquaticitalea lipolytica]